MDSGGVSLFPWTGGKIGYLAECGRFFPLGLVAKLALCLSAVDGEGLRESDGISQVPLVRVVKCEVTRWLA